jgi:hypothetical protein
MPNATVTQAPDVPLAPTDPEPVGPPTGDRPADFVDDPYDATNSGPVACVQVATRSKPSKLALLAEERRRRSSESQAATSPAPAVEPDLGELADRINTRHRWGVIVTRDAEALILRRLKLARSTGAELAMAKARVAHGGWERWVRDHLVFDVRMARNYLRIFERWDVIEPMLDQNRQPVAGLTIKNVLRGLAKPRPSPAPAPPAERAGFDANVGENEPPESMPPDLETFILRSGPSPAALEPPPAEPAGPLALPGPAGEGRDRHRDDLLVDSSRLDGTTVDLPESVFSTTPTPAEPTAPRPVWPGVDDQAGAAVLDEIRERLQAALRAFPRLYEGPASDPWKLRALWSASAPYREQVAALLSADTPRAVAVCGACDGDGDAGGRLCAHCAGAGWTLVK